MNYRHCRAGFSLLELLVVVAVIGVLMGLSLSAVQKVRAAATKLACANRLNQVALASQHYLSITGTYPPTGGPVTSPPPLLLGVPWYVTLLPHIDNDHLYRATVEGYQQMSVSGMADNLDGHPHLKSVVKTYTCPDDSRLSTPLTDDLGVTAAYVSYVGVTGKSETPPDVPVHDGVFAKGPVLVRHVSSITDGTSNTLFAGERPPLGKYLGGIWYTGISMGTRLPAEHDAHIYNLAIHVNKPTATFTCRGPIYYGPGRLDNDCDYPHFWSLHSGGANFAFCDGSVRFLPYTARPVMPALATIAGGEVVSLE